MLESAVNARHHRLAASLKGAPPHLIYIICDMPAALAAVVNAAFAGAGKRIFNRQDLHLTIATLIFVFQKNVIYVIF